MTRLSDGAYARIVRELRGPAEPNPELLALIQRMLEEHDRTRADFVTRVERLNRIHEEHVACLERTLAAHERAIAAFRQTVDAYKQITGGE